MQASIPSGARLPSKNIKAVKPKTADAQESWVDYGLRTGARTASRAAESVAGLPGDISALGRGIASKGVEAFTGFPGTFEQPQEQPSQTRAIEEGLKSPSYLARLGASELLESQPSSALPTSEELKGASEKLTGNYTKARTPGEEGWDQVIGDLSLMLTPGSVVGKGLKGASKAVARKVGTATAGNMAKWALDDAGFSPLIGSGVKMGVMALGSMLGGRAELRALKEKSYEDAKKILGDARINVADEAEYINKELRKLIKSDAPEKKNMIERLSSFLPNVENETASVQDLINLKQSWNKWIRDPSTPQEVRILLGEAVDKLKGAISKYGRKNPEFFKPYMIGEELTAAIKGQNWVQKLLSKSRALEKSIKNPIIKNLLFHGTIQGIAQAFNPWNIGVAGATLSSTLAAQHLMRFAKLLWNSPVARKHYGNMLTATVKEEAGAFIKEAKALDKAADAFIKKNPDFMEGRSFVSGEAKARLPKTGAKAVKPSPSR